MMTLFKKTQIKKALILLVLIGFMSTSSAQTLTMLTVGDSITAGLKRNASSTYWFCPVNGLVSSSFQSCNGFGKLNLGGYQPDLKQKLASAGVNANVYNWGVAGDESWNTVGEANRAMNARPTAEAIFIMTGVNDLNDFVSASTTIQSVQAIVDNALARGVQPIVGTVTPHRASRNYEAKVKQINDGIKAMAASRGVPVADHNAAMVVNWGLYNSGDNLHISDAGDALMANLWAQAYEQTLSGAIVTPVIKLLLLDN